MKMKAFLTVFLAIIIIAAVIVYLNKSLILNKIKAAVLENIESQIGRKVSIDKIEFKLLKGIVINDLEIFPKTPDEPVPFIKVKELSFRPVLFPFIFNKKILIPSVDIDSLNINVVRLKENNWNFSDIIKSLSTRPKTPPKFSVIVMAIKINNSQLLFQDKTLAFSFSKKLKNLNAVLKPSLPTSLKFDVAAKLENVASDTDIGIDGKIDLSAKTVKCTANIKNLLLVDYLPYFNDIPLTIKDGSLSTKLTADFKDGKLNLEGTKTIQGLDIQKDSIQIQTDIASDYKFIYDTKNQAQAFDYKAIVDVIRGRISGLPYTKELSNINGRFSVVPNKLTFEEIKGEFLGNTLKLSGGLENFQNPYLDAKINSSLSLSALKETLQDIINLKDFEIDGDSQLELSIKGALLDAKNLDFQGEIKLSDARLKTVFLPEQIDKIQADINFDKTAASWKNLSANFKNVTYASNGSINNFLSPRVRLNLSSDLLNLETEFNIRDKIVQIAKLTGNYSKSQFDVQGSIDMAKTDNPLLSIQANALLDLNDLSNLSPELKQALDMMKLSGLVNAQAELNGRLRDYNNWQLIINSESENLSIYGLKISEAKLNYSQGNSSLADLRLTALPYSGNLTIKVQLDLADKNIAFISNIIIDGVDISKLKADTTLKDKELSGTFSCGATLKGTAKDIKNSLNGSGGLRIEKGNLWQLTMLKGLGEYLFIPEYQKIVFTEASGDFLIGQGRISTDNLTLESQPVNILCEGNIDFGGNIDFTLTTQLAEGLIKDSSDLRGIISSILAQSTNAIVIKLTGTLKEPKYKIVPLPANLFKKAKDFIIQEILP